MIWGRLDAAYANSGLSVSLPEACRLSDALVSQLRVQTACACRARHLHPYAAALPGAVLV